MKKEEGFLAFQLSIRQLRAIRGRDDADIWPCRQCRFG
jgi:hypothetical protein